MIGRRRGLRFPLMVVAAAAFLVAPVALLAILSLGTVDRHLVGRSDAERANAAQSGAAVADATIGTANDSLQLLGRRPVVREALRRADLPALTAALADLRSVSSAYASAAAFTPGGVMLARDPDGGSAIGANFSSRDYFAGAVAVQRPYVSEVYRSLVAPYGPLVAVAYAVREGEGRIVGVLQLTFAPASILRALDPVSRVEGRSIAVLDRMARVIASTDPGLEPLSEASGLAGARPAASGGTSVRAVVGGKDHFVSAAPLTSSDWTLYVFDDPAVVLGLHRDLERQLLGGVGATAIVAVLLGLVLAVLSERGARQRDALRVARGDLTSLNAELEDAGRHKSEFLANMSHELRTPLNAILGFSQLLDEQLQASITPRQRRYLHNISDAGTHLLALINDVLDLSKVEAGRIELRPEQTTVHAVVEPVVSAARASADAGGIRLDVVIESAILTVDAGRLRQILYNLLSNAVKFTPPQGRVGLRIWTAGGDLHAEVSDSGIGIPADRQARVFGVFERVNEDRSGSEGTGLGLALTKRLVELHSGTISFQSAVGAGTTFSLRLPGLVRDDVSGDRVLVIEDDPRAADLAVAISAALGLRTEVATTVSAALAAARRAAPVAVLLDLQLADARGETVLRELRACVTTREIPIAVTSVEDDDGRSRALGADEYFRKPVDHVRLGAWLRSVAERAAVASAA